MLLIMRKFFIKTIVVSFCFVSFNTQALESIYLICEKNYETTVFGFVVSLKNKAQLLVSDSNVGTATGYKADSSGNEFIDKPSEYTDDARIYENQLSYSDYTIDRTTGEAIMRWKACIHDIRDNPFICMGTLGRDDYEWKEEFIGKCNAVSKSEAKAKARQVYKPAPEPKKKF